MVNNMTAWALRAYPKGLTPLIHLTGSALPPMITTRHHAWFQLSIPGAARLASLAGIKADLYQVAKYCDRMTERYAGAHLKLSPFDIVGFTTYVDIIDWEALSTAASVAYSRCFVSGVRRPLDAALLNSEEAELRSTHEYILHFRNKHVAHSVNSLETNSVTVHVEDSFQSSAEIISVVPAHTRQTGFAFDGPAKLKNLVNWWLAKVREESRVELQAVLQLVQAMPIEKIREFDGLGATLSSEDRQSSVGKSRTQP